MMEHNGSQPIVMILFAHFPASLAVRGYHGTSSGQRELSKSNRDISGEGFAAHSPSSCYECGCDGWIWGSHLATMKERPRQSCGVERLWLPTLSSSPRSSQRVN